MMTLQNQGPADGATLLVDAYLAAWSEPDDRLRRAAIEECWASDGLLVDPPLSGSGHSGVGDVMQAMQDHYPGHRFVRTTIVDQHHDVFRVGWELRSETELVALTGVDVGLIDEEGRLSRVNGFFDVLPGVHGDGEAAG